MNRRSTYSYLLVGVQFACLIVLAVTGPLVARQPIALLMEILGFSLGVWAVAAMRLPNFNVTPDVKKSGRMVAHGPYRIIRHPMYAALLVIGAALVLDYFSWLRLLVWVVLAVNLLIKLHYEETLLQHHFPAYRTYMEQTKRLVPGIY